jgi:hypothetical protein
VAESDGRRDNAKGSHKRVVGGTKTCEDEGDVLSGGDRAASSGKFIDYALHLGEVCRRGHVQLLRVGQSDAEVRDLGFALRGEHLLKGLPYSGGVLNPMYMR